VMLTKDPGRSQASQAGADDDNAKVFSGHFPGLLPLRDGDSR
jgi:hypothetical protein